MKVRRLVSLTAVVSVFYCVVTLEVKAQGHQGHADHIPVQTAEPSIDGSVSPELIPDDVAIRLLMKSLRLPADPDPASMNRLSGRIAKAELSSSDLQILAREMEVFDSLAKTQEMRISVSRPFSDAPDSAAFKDYLSEQQKLRSMTVSHYRRLLAAVSPVGRQKLTEHLSHVKSRIRIYPVPEMREAER